MDKCIRKAYAKINLGLDVVRRLENGYHEVRMIMQTVDICDVLNFGLTVKIISWGFVFMISSSVLRR